MNSPGNWLKKQKLTAILTVKTMATEINIAYYEFLEYMADCVIHFDQRILSQVTTRRLHVTKYRGSGFGRNEYPYVISDEGVNVIPISTANLGYKPLGKKMSSGNSRLDTILNGGYQRGACILLAGTSGCGKTTLAALFAHAACQRGEKVLYVGYEESTEAIINNMLSPGIDLRSVVDSGKLHFLSMLPESMGAEEHLISIAKKLKRHQSEHIIVDAISACQRMGSKQSGFDFLMRLLDICKERGVTIIFINQTSGDDLNQLSGNGISSMIDTAILMRYLDSGDEFNRLLMVMKSRGSSHSNQYREYCITDDGIELLDVYIGEGGVLTGVARQEQLAREAAEHRRQQQIIEHKKSEIAQKKAALEAQILVMNADVEVSKAALETLLSEEEIIKKSRGVRADMRGQDFNSAVLEQDKVKEVKSDEDK